MTITPAEITLELKPSARLDVIDVTRSLASEADDALSRYRKALYCSYHTTAGYLEQSLCARLEHSRERLGSFLHAFQEVFPPDANYEHDKLYKREELTDEQRRTEPRNADSHLAFISSGLRNCVTYVNRADTPVYFIDLDGVSEHGARTRKTTVLGYDRDEVVESAPLTVAVSSHPIDSINLADEIVGLIDRLEEMVRRHGVTAGRIDLSIDAEETHAGLTVNEYETLLMRHDLAEVLADPVRFMAQKGRNMLRDPRAIPGKTRDYASYDLVRVLNRLIDATGFSESIVERLVAKVLAAPAARFLRIKRGVSLLVTERNGRGAIARGTYQSPILVQWQKAAGGVRRLRVDLVRFS